MTNVNNGQHALNQAMPPVSQPNDTAAAIPAVGIAAAITLPSVSINDLTTAIAEATTAYVSSRKNAATAAATVFYVWSHACAEHAPQANKDWYATQLAVTKADIDAHNSNLDEEKKDEDKKLKAEIKDFKAKNPLPNSPTAKQKYDEEIATLKNASTARKKAIAAQRKVKIEVREGAAPFTDITKFVLKLHEPTQASQVHRFATVVNWLSSQFKDDPNCNIGNMADAILDAGGFEDVYDLQRGSDAKTLTNAASQNNGTKADDTVTRTAVIDYFSDVASKADGIAVPDIAAGLVGDGLYTLIARKDANGMTVISEFAVPTEEALRLCVQYNDNKLLPGDARAEFAATALLAGELIEEGKRTVKGGESVVVCRALTLLAEPDASTMIVSAANAEASVVVRATPKLAASTLFAEHGLWQMHQPDFKNLQERLSDAEERKMVTLEANEDEREIGEDLLLSKLAWITTNGPLKNKGDENGVATHAWLPMWSSNPAPLDVEGFAPAGTVTVTRDELHKLAKGKIGAWSITKEDSKVVNKLKNRVEMVVSKSTVTISTHAGDDKVVCNGQMKGTAKLFFRPRMLSKLITKLAEMKVGDIKLSPDVRGALCVSFENDHGFYEVYMPSCNEDGHLLTTRFHKIRVADADEV